MKGVLQFDAYAAFYDLLYKDKNYKAEANYIDRIIGKFLAKKKESCDLLDLACGTGKHLFHLYDKGYASLSGSDISSPMIKIARDNAKIHNSAITFYNHSFQTASKIKKKFDVIVSMFSAVDYIVSYEDQSKTLKNVHNLLNRDGLFIFDYWNGNAVVKNYSPVKVLRKKNGDEEIIRISETRIDPINQDAFVKFVCMYFKEGAKMSEFEEVHHLHYYYFAEMKNLLKSHRFEILHISPFMQMSQKVASDDWNISVVAKKI